MQRSVSLDEKPKKREPASEPAVFAKTFREKKVM
jgi:hypothetical protein